MRKIAPVARPQVGEQIDPVQMEILLAGINIIAERLCHGVGGHIEIHPADKMFRRIPDRDLTAVRTLEGPADKERRNGADFQCNDNRTSFQDRSLLCDSI